MYDQIEDTLTSITMQLRSAINDLCAEYGKVAYLDVLTMAQAEKRWALCLLRLESAAQEQALMRALDVLGASAKTWR